MRFFQIYSANLLITYSVPVDNMHLNLYLDLDDKAQMEEPDWFSLGTDYSFKNSKLIHIFVGYLLFYLSKVRLIKSKNMKTVSSKHTENLFLLPHL